MPFTLTMPKLSPTMEEGSIAKWHKKVGEKVEAGELLLEVSTDKATVEYNALDSGWIRKIIVPEGGEAIVNQPIAILTEEKDESIESYQPEGEKPKAEVQVATPEAKTKKPEESQPSKTTESAPAPAQQKTSLAQPAFQPEKPLENYNFSAPGTAAAGRILVSPLARKLAKEQDLDLSSVKGSGPSGRIMKRDLENAKSSGTRSFGRREIPKEQPGSYDEIKLTPIRKVVAQRLQEAKTFIPHFYVQQAINAQPLVDIREQLKNLDIKVTYNDLVIRAAALSLREHPVINSGFNPTNNTVLQFKTIDIAVAVSIPDGLITPIVRHADFKNVGEISAEVKNLSAKAKEGKLATHEFKGGSFTISNLGMYGITDFQAIINPPQAAILAVSGILDVPVVRNTAIVPGKVMNVTLSVDHRVIDGVAAAEFLKTLQKYLENPASLLL